MSQEVDDVIQKMEDLESNLREMPTYLKCFSDSMLSLYSTKAVGSKKEAAEKFRKLRDDTRNDAMVYLNSILPLTTNFVASISDYFENYEALDYEEWDEDLEDILEEVVGYQQVCETLLKMHKEITEPLKKRKVEAELIVNEFKDLKKEFEKNKTKLEKKANIKHDWAMSLDFVPVVNIIASPILKYSADKDLANAVAMGAEANVQEAAANTVREKLIPALQSFIEGLSAAAGFFKAMKIELKTFATKKDLEKKKRHYDIMKNKAKDMKALCRNFYAVLPNVETDFGAIPREGTDQNYVDRWLEKQMKIIRETCTVRRVAESMLKAITAYEYLPLAQQRHNCETKTDGQVHKY